MNVFFINRKIRRVLTVMALFGCGMSFFVGTALAECTVSFSWLPNAESNITGYKIYYGQTKGGPYLSVAEIGKPAPVDGRILGSVPDLNCGEQYYFVCVAINDVGVESDPSVEVPVVPSSIADDTIPIYVPGFELTN